MAEECRSIQLIDGDGVFRVNDLEEYTRSVKLAECGLSYAVVSVMGAQSSGKSTLLNHLFGTNFKVMDFIQGRSKTTKGVWLAKCVDIEPCTLVMDLEGTDGRERGEDDTAFEKQSALFALAVSDIVLINMWCHDIGREQAANKPLLKTVFQVMMRVFTPRRTTLLFVLRDKTKSPLEILEPILREDLQKIWDSVPKPYIHKEAPFSDFFIVDFVALSNYEEKVEEFREQVASLRQRFFHSIALGGLAGDRQGVVPASGFSFSLQQIWKIIKKNKDLDLPSHKVMVATVRCEAIANEKLSSFHNDESWHQIEKIAKANIVLGFGRKISQILGSCLSEYDMEAVYFDDSVKEAKREQLKSKLLQLVQPAYHSILGHLRSKTLDDFKVALDEDLLDGGKEFEVIARDCTQTFLSLFDDVCADAAVQQSEWDPSKSRDELRCDIDAHISSVRSTKLAELKALSEAQLKAGLRDPVEALLDTADDSTWPAIRKLLLHETKLTTSGLSSVLSAFDIDEATKDKMLLDLEHFARSVVESKAKEEAGQVLIRMKDRFFMLFSHDSDSMPRIWTGNEDIIAITKTARAASLKVLSVMAAIRLDDKADSIDKTLSLALLNPIKPRFLEKSVLPLDLLASSSWEEVSSSKTLLTPVRCKYLWRRFKAETEYIVTQAIAAQEANRHSNWPPPSWAIAAIMILGFNEFMALLRNPFYLGVIFIVFLLAKAFGVFITSGEFQNGTLFALLSLSTKFLSSVMDLIKGLAAEGQPSAPVDDRRGPALNTEFQN